MNETSYIEEVTAYFIQMRGHHSAVSPRDWVMIETWQKQGIPLKVVFQGIDEAVVNKAVASRLTLEHCDGIVQKCWESYRALMQGKNRSVEEEESPQEVIQRLVPRLIEKVYGSIESGLQEWFSGHSGNVLKKISRALDGLSERTAAGEYTDYSDLAQAMEEVQHKIMHLLEGLDKTCKFEYSAIDKCVYPRMDLVRLFTFEDECDS